MRGHSALQGTDSGLVCLLLLSCLLLSIPGQLPPAFEAPLCCCCQTGYPTSCERQEEAVLLFPDKKICNPTASSKPLTLLTDFQQTLTLNPAKIQNRKNSEHIFIILKQIYFIPGNIKTDKNQLLEVHLESVRISTADTNLPEPLLDGLTHASVNKSQTSIRCRASGGFGCCTDKPYADQEFSELSSTHTNAHSGSAEGSAERV